MAENNYLEYQYPELTPGSASNNGKYWHALSQASQDSLSAVQQLVEKENIDLKELGTNDLHPSLLILRYLRANQFNATKTIAHIQKNLEWRKTMNVAALVVQRPEQILGCTLEELTHVFPHWHSGYDKTGRPVLYKQYGKFEAGLVKKLVGGKSFDNVVRYHLWEQEACGRLCLAQSLKDKKIVETITGVIDIKDMSMSQITSDFLKLTKLLAEVDQNQYPETLGRAFIINAPAAFPLVWRMVKPWLDPATVAKIQVLGGPKEYIPVLQDFIGEENLPSNYGGTLPPLSPQVHPYEETMATLPTETASSSDESKEPEEVEVFDEAVLLYPYPELTPGSTLNNGKYWQQLSETSQDTLNTLHQWVEQDRVNLKQLGTTDLHPSLMLLRYLRANQFNAKKAIAHLQKNIEWRRTKDIDSLILQRPEVILGCSLEELTAVFPHWHSGYDKTGRPVLFKQYGKFDAVQVKKLCGGSFDKVVRYHLWEQEACGRLCLAQSKKTGLIVETITGVIDIKDMGMSQITSDFLKLTKLLAEVDQNQYPETLGRAFIINAPAAFPLVWRMVKPWLDPATVAKIQVLGGPKEYIPVLQDFIGEENLPSNYGGTLPPLSPQVHPYAETMMTYPSAAKTPEEPNEKKEAFDPQVLLYPYPELTPGAIPDNGKYWMQLNSSAQESLAMVEQWVARDKIDLKQLGTTDLHPSLMLLRYLRANQFNAKKAIAHLQKNIEWRRTKDIDSLILQRPEVILGCSLEELTAVFPHWHSGYDKTGRPVLFKQYGKFDAVQVKKLCGGSFDNVVRYHLWEQEACGRLCLAQSKKTGLIVETITGVIDIKDMGMSQITRDFLSLTKLLAEVDQNQYPETLGRAFIINAPAAFPLVWRMVKPWLDPATVAKIQVLGGPKEYIPVLQDFIGEENLPSNYGGTLPPLSPQVHPYAETMMTYTDAAASNDADARAAYARVNDRNSFRNNRNAPRRNSSRNMAEDSSTVEQPSFSLLYYPNLLWTGIQKNWFLGSSPEDDNESAWEGDSDKSDDSDELHFEDAFESQSDLETNSHSHLYSARHSEGNNAAPVRKKKKRSWWGKLFVVKAATRCYRRMVFDKQVRRLTVQRLESRFIVGAAVHLLCAISCAAISATALAEISWSSEGARLQLWAYTVVLLVSCFMIIFDFVGYYGLQTKNWPLLVMYASGIVVGSLLFAACTIACFLYYSLPGITGVGSSSLNSTLSKNRSFMMSLALGSLFVTLCGVVPLTLVRGVIIKLREQQGKHLQTRQIQIVLKIAQSISTIAAITMLCYGGLGMEYLLKIQYVASLFAVYGLVYGGVSVLITSTIGVWASNTVHRSVLRLYQYFVLPFIISLLLVIALVCFDDLYYTEAEVHDAYPDLHTTESEEKVKSNVQTFLLVTGILTIVLCVFQTLSLVATRALSSTIDSNGQVKEKIAILQAIKEKELGIYSSGLMVNGEEVLNKDSYWSEFSVEHLGRLYMLYSRNQRDRFLIAWGVAMGLFNIFVNGTLAVFSRYANGSGIQTNWMFGLLQFLGRADDRFIRSNAYLRSSETLLALIVGPLLLFYAWATFVYAPYRHVLGMLVSSSQMLIWTLYFVIELYAGLKHFQGHHAPVLLAFIIIFGSTFYLFIPGWILFKELSASTNDTSTSDSHELLMEANNDSKPFLDKFDFESLESGTMHDTTDGHPLPGAKKARPSESSLEQMLGLGARARKPVTPESAATADDASTASTRSFIRGLGSGSVDSNTELELYRARAASAFTVDSGSRSVAKPLYSDMPSARRMSAAQLELAASDGDLSDTGGERKEEEKEAELETAGALTSPHGYPQALSPTRALSPPMRARGLNDHFGTPTIPGESQLSLYSPSGLTTTSLPPLPPPQLTSHDHLGSFLRQRSAAPLRPRGSQEQQVSAKGASLAGGITQVAAATAALDPNKILPMLMKLGVSSVEAAGMMTYLMRMKELSEGKKKKNSLAMVV